MSGPRTEEEEEEIYKRISAIYRAVKWKTLEVGIKQLPNDNESSPGDMLGVAMGLIGAAMWIEEQNRNTRNDKTNQTKRKKAFLQLVGKVWDDERFT
jgi:hypothetical protein